MGRADFWRDSVRDMAHKTIRPATCRDNGLGRVRGHGTGRIGAAAEIYARQRAGREVYLGCPEPSRMAATSRTGGARANARTGRYSGSGGRIARSQTGNSACRPARTGADGFSGRGGRGSKVGRGKGGGGGRGF